MLFEVFCKEGIIRKVQFIRYFLNRLVCRAEKNFCFQYNVFIYPIMCSSSACSLDYIRQVFCGYEKFFCIELQCSVFLIITNYQLYKPAQQFFFSFRECSSVLISKPVI